MRSLQLLVQWYNKLTQTLLEVEFPLVRAQMESIDVRLARAESDLTWRHEDCWSFINTTKDLVHDLLHRVSKAKDNCQTIQSVMKAWGMQAMFFRKNKRKGSLVHIEERADHVKRKNSCIKKDGDVIHELVQVDMLMV